MFKSRLALACTTLFLAAACSSTPDAPPSPLQTTTITNAPISPTDQVLVDAFVVALQSIPADGPGCSAAVGNGGHVMWAAASGLADIGAGTPLTPDTMVDIASVSKQFTANAILLLVQDGLVDLDAPISTYLDGYPAWAAEVTVLDLMQHTSGIPDYVGPLIEEEGHDLLGVTTQEQAYEVIAASTDLDRPPGERFEYINSNYVLLAQIVDNVSGQPLDQFLAERVFDTLELNMTMDPSLNADTVAAAAGDGGMARSYQRDGKEWVVADSGWLQIGDGAIRTTPSALVRWSAEYLEPELLDSQTARLRTSRAENLVDGLSYGAGVILSDNSDKNAIWHNGGWSGFSSDFTLVTDTGSAFAVTCNALSMAEHFAESVADTVEEWRGF